jgi:hypothetical protein
MASISRDPGGQRRILFVASDGKRKAVRLGKASQRAAEAVKFRVEQLLAAKLTGHALEADTAAWIGNLDPAMADKLARVGLIQRKEKKASALLDSFLTSYIVGRTDLKPLTLRHLNDARRHLIGFFGADKSLTEISPGDADDFRRSLATRLGDKTVRRMCGRAKQFFRAALRKRLIQENPFADMRGCVVQANRDRDYFVSRLEAEKVLAACPPAPFLLPSSPPPPKSFAFPTHRVYHARAAPGWALVLGPRIGRYLCVAARAAINAAAPTRRCANRPRLTTTRRSRSNRLESRPSKLADLDRRCFRKAASANTCSNRPPKSIPADDQRRPSRIAPDQASTAHAPARRLSRPFGQQ